MGLCNDYKDVFIFNSKHIVLILLGLAPSMAQESK